jgi:phosphotriesterase-related protein
LNIDYRGRIYTKARRRYAMNTKGSANTVLGPVPVDDLGLTLMHEHLAAHFPGWEYDAKGRPFDVETIAQHCAELLKAPMAHGMRTLVDAGPADAGRHPLLQKRVAELTGLNIICSTGLHTEIQGSSGYLKFRTMMGFDTTTELYETYVKDITEGIGNTGVKAGIVKVCTGLGTITEYEQRSLKAAARAQKETGVPIITHTEGGTMGPEQADLLISEGADPKRIVIGHCNATGDMHYFYRILEKGVSIAFDRMGSYIEVPEAVVTACIIGLINRGYADHIMLSHDYIGYWLGREPAMATRDKIEERMGTGPAVPAIMSTWCYTHIFTDFIPKLKKMGVSDETVNTIMVGNIRRLFGGDK